MATPTLDKGTLYKGRQIDFGFEPCANAFFDFYVTPKYIDPPLLQLEDIAFFLFLRKNVNLHNPGWKMPSIRQMMRRLGVSQRKLEAMMARLIKARLLEKVSGYRAGENGQNIPNDYLLADPLSTRQEFLACAAKGGFSQEIGEQWKDYVPKDYAPKDYVPEEDPVRVARTGGREGGREQPTDLVRATPTYKQTSSDQQTGWDDLWVSVLEVLRMQVPQATYYSFVERTRLVELGDGAATIVLGNPRAKDWIENRLMWQLKKLLSFESKAKIETIRVVAESEWVCPQV